MSKNLQNKHTRNFRFGQVAVSELFTLKTSLNQLSFKELFVYLRQIIMDNERDQTDIQEAGRHRAFRQRRDDGPAQQVGQSRDRLSFRDFLGLSSGDKVPDGKTIRAFKEELTKKGLFEQLFDKFYTFLEENNLIMHEGVMIDGSFVEVPRRRNTREENRRIKEGRGGELWNR